MARKSSRRKVPGRVRKMEDLPPVPKAKDIKGRGGDVVPMDSVALNFSKIKAI